MSAGGYDVVLKTASKIRLSGKTFEKHQAHRKQQQQANFINCYFLAGGDEKSFPGIGNDVLELASYFLYVMLFEVVM